MKVHHEGRGILVSFFLIFSLIDLLAFWASPTIIIPIILLLGTLTLMGLALNFFRKPNRHNPGNQDEDILVAPADGKLVTIEETYEPEILKKQCLKVSIFMSIYDVHANWFACNGVVRHVSHTDGNFHKAFLPKSSTENERSAVVIETPKGHQILERQIAGAVARRIMTYAQEGDNVTVNDFVGFIKFGSRIDLYLPLGTEIFIKPETAVKGNTTVIGKLPSAR
ncbi:MAG: phosphatidylserine decarboxylase family protein [Bacteroidales bacterium]|nr:phosphatidylserine decarboxylase family protein [Porphyromonas sp.]MDD6935096.1 phosphatidylserine decarboxylase family protein [Bacteroidales bacterium]MDY3102344.1 phosphatidylserine decarboxylase family protein [Porphyromonas sp.]